MAVQDTNTDIKFCIATADNIGNQPIQNGVVYYDPSGSVAALDWRNTRYYASKFIPAATSAAYTSMTKIANSVYYIIDSNILYFWNGVTSTRINLSGGLPDVTASDNGKILRVVNGAWSLVAPTVVYVGTSTPEQSLGSNGDIYLQTS